VFNHGIPHQALRSFILAIGLALPSTAFGQAFGDPMQSGAFATAMTSESAVMGLTTVDDNAQLEVRDARAVQASLDACTDPGMSIFLFEGQRYFFVHGTTFVDADEYALLGTRTLTSAANSSDLRAQAAAVRYLRGLTVTVNALDFEGTSTTREGTASGGVIQSVLTTAWERSELQSIASRSAGTLVGGSRIGQRIVIMPPNPGSTESAGLCVLVRWSFPMDQQSWSPARQPVTPAAPGGAATPAAPPRSDGFILPPSGVYGTF